MYIRFVCVGVCVCVCVCDSSELFMSRAVCVQFPVSRVMRFALLFVCSSFVFSPENISTLYRNIKEESNQ